MELIYYFMMFVVALVAGLFLSTLRTLDRVKKRLEALESSTMIKAHLLQPDMKLGADSAVYRAMVESESWIDVPVNDVVNNLMAYLKLEPSFTEREPGVISLAPIPRNVPTPPDAK